MSIKNDLLSRRLQMAAIVAAGICIGAVANTDETAPAAEAKSTEKQDSLTVANVNGSPITLDYLEMAMSTQAPMLRREPMTEEKGRELLEKIVNMELLSEEARRRGYDQNPEVISIYKNQLASLMHKKIATAVDDETPPEEALRKYYDDHLDSYHKPEKVRVRNILIKDKTKALKLLREVQKKKMNQQEFRRLAQEVSEDEETKMRGGDLGFFTLEEQAGDTPAKIEIKIRDAAFKLKKNGETVKNLVETEKGYHILMRTGHRSKLDLSFEEVRNRLIILVRREMRRTRIEQAVEDLKKNFPVKVYEENLKYVVIDLSAGPRETTSSSGHDIRKRLNQRRATSKKRTTPPTIQKK